MQQRGDIQKEFKLAIDTFREIPPGEIFIIPVKLNECEIPYDEVNKLRCQNLFPDWSEGVKEILKVIRNKTQLIQNVKFLMKGQRRAVIVGINKYEDDPSIPTLEGAENDAKELFDKLIDKNTYNFAVDESHILLGKNATCFNIRKAISDVFWKTGKYDIALFYFSGHGFDDGYGHGYIAPWDMKKNEPFVNGIKMIEITEVMAKSIGKKNTILFLDCCYSRLSTIVTTTLDTYINLDKYEGDGEGRYAFVATSENKSSREEEVFHNGDRHHHGKFTFHLLNALDGHSNFNNTGIISIGKIQNYIKNCMSNTQSQELRTSFTKGTNIEKIILSISSAAFNNYIEDSLRKVDELCDDNELNTLQKAGDIIREIENIPLNNENIIPPEIKIKINKYINLRKECLRNFLIAYQDHFQEDLNKTAPNLYIDLLDELDYFSIDRINVLNRHLFECLNLISLYMKEENGSYRIIKSNMTSDEITHRLNAIRNNLIAKYNSLNTQPLRSSEPLTTTTKSSEHLTTTTNLSMRISS